MFVAVVMKHEMRMRHIVVLACPAVHYFPTLPHKSLDFLKRRKLRNMKCVLRFSLQIVPEETFFVLRRTGRDMITNIYWSSCKVLVILVRFY